MKRTFIILLVFLAVSLFSQDKPFNCLSDNSSRTEISFEIPAFQLEKETRSNSTLHSIIFENGRSLEGIRETGLPQVPTFSQLIEIPQLSKVIPSLEILEEEILTDIFLTPCQSLEDPNRDPLLILNNEIYSANQLFPAKIIFVSNPGIMRNHLVAQLQFNPIRYNPVTRELHIIRKAKINLKYINDSTGLRASSKPTSEAFEKMIASSLLNPNITINRDTPAPGSYLFVYQESDSVRDLIEYLANWKHRKGFEVNILSTEETGTQASSIREYIRTAYAEWSNPPEFICIIGDGYTSNNIPVFYETINSENIHGDFPYTLLAGEDQYPDAVVGRIPFNSLFELQTVISKIMSYELFSGYETDWINNTILLGDGSSSGSSTVTTMKYVKDVVSNYNYEMDFTEIYEEPYPTQVLNALNSGSGAYFYRGFAGMSGWGNSENQQLNNVGMNPYHIGITCNNAYLNSDSYMEQLFHVGTPGTQLGIVAGIGSSGITHTCFNNIATGGIARSLYQDGVNNLGTALMQGKMDLITNFPNNPFQYQEWYNMILNLIGDPGMSIWKDNPIVPTVNHPAQLPLAANNINVSVLDEDGNPIENAWVTLLKTTEDLEEVFSSVYTDSNGEALLFFECETIGELKLTVTGTNIIPFLADIPVMEPESYISVEELTNVTEFQSGGSASFKLNLKNHGATALDNISATISCESELCEIIQSSSDFATIQPGSTIASNSDYEMNISPLCSSDDLIDIVVNVSSGDSIYTDIIRLSASAPLLSLESYNSSVNLIPGLSTDLSLNIINLGTQIFAQSEIVLSSNSSYVEIFDSTAVLSSILPDESATSSEDDLAITLSGNCLPGMTFPLLATLTDQNGLIQTVDFEIELETSSVNDPTGPDAYGYFCYDDGDTAYDMAPTYNWIELDPTYGGDGTVLDLEDNDSTGGGDMETITLPFPITFYGEIYNQLSISSNGYVMPGIHETIEWMNWSIPGSMVPSPIIAPFWDDLLIADSAVCWKYDETEHLIIVEWSHLRNRHDNSVETFQLSISDPNFTSSFLGDSVIKFQYKEINNIDVGSYDGTYVYHGQYATVGIGNNNSTIGLEYTFCNEYPLSARELQNEMALLFYGPDTMPIHSLLLLSDITIGDATGNNNGLPDAGETIQFSPTLVNRGQQTAEAISATLSSNNPYINITQNQIDFMDIASNEEATSAQPFVLEIAELCPNLNSANLELTLQYSGYTTEIEYSLASFAPDLGLAEYNFEESIEEDSHLGNNESGIFHLTLSKNSYQDVNNAQISLICSHDGVTISESSQSFPAITTDEITIDFPVETSFEVEGMDVTFTIQMEADNLSKTAYIDYTIGHFQQILIDEFETTQANWETMNGRIVAENLAGGSGNELHLEPTATEYAYLNYSSHHETATKVIQLRFKYHQSGSAESVTFTGSDGQFNWESEGLSESPQEAMLEYENIAFDDHYILFMIYALPNEEPLIFAMDDLEIYGIRAPASYLIGQVELTGGEGDISEVLISNGIESTHPDEDGNYILEIEPGSHTITAELEGYAKSILGNYATEAGIIYDLDFNLNFLSVPQNLTYELVNNDVQLSWEFDNPESQFRDDLRNPEFDDFLITYRINNNYTTTDATVDTFFTKNLTMGGDYEISVKARYSGGSSSLSSEPISFQFVTSSDPNEIPAVYQLAQNHPNPFNPSTTIRFDLPEAASKCNLSIYNCKGQLVNTLVNEAKPAGRYNEAWNGKDNVGKQVSSGIYLYKLSTDVNKTTIRKMILLK